MASKMCKHKKKIKKNTYLVFRRFVKTGTSRCAKNEFLQYYILSIIYLLCKAPVHVKMNSLMQCLPVLDSCSALLFLNPTVICEKRKSVINYNTDNKGVSQNIFIKIYSPSIILSAAVTTAFPNSLTA